MHFCDVIDVFERTYSNKAFVEFVKVHQPNVLGSEMSVMHLAFVYQLPGCTDVQVLLSTVFVDTRNETLLWFSYHNVYVVAVVYF
jgi:hypothetical protein